MHSDTLIAAAGLFVIAAFAALAVLFTDANASCALAQGNACASSCRSAYNDCRISTKGSSSCDAQYQACLRSCVKH
jgi:hypothetical protein